MTWEDAYLRYIAYLEGVICVMADDVVWQRVGIERNAIFDEVCDVIKCDDDSRY